VTNTHNKIQWIIYYKASIELWISFSLLSCQLVRLDLYVVSRSKAEYRNVTLGYFFLNRHSTLVIYNICKKDGEVPWARSHVIQMKIEDIRAWWTHILSYNIARIFTSIILQVLFWGVEGDLHHLPSTKISSLFHNKIISYMTVFHTIQ
jgi:hypothetical protein